MTTAIHEAGHILACERLGVKWDYAELLAPGQDLAGHMRHEPLPAAAHRARALLSLAGPVAEYLYQERPEEPDLCDMQIWLDLLLDEETDAGREIGGDVNIAWRAVAAERKTGRAQARLFSRRIAEATAMVREDWARIEELAARLRRDGFVSPAKVRE